MKAALVSLALAFALIPAPAVEVSGKVLILTDEEMAGLKGCDGSCHLVNEAAMRDLAKRYFEQGFKAGQKEAGDACWANT